MCSWFKLNLGDAMLASQALSDIKASLSLVYEKAGKPECMTAIYRHESQGLHCKLVIYLTKEYQQAAMLKDALSCNIPRLSDSSFLAGNKRLI